MVKALGGSLCGECCYWSAIYPYEEGLCQRHRIPQKKSEALVYETRGQEQEACPDFSFYAPIRAEEGRD